MNNSQNWLSSVNNSVMIRIVMAFYKIMGFVVFNFSPTPCKYDDIWSIIGFKRIKYKLMRVTIQILDTEFETSEYSKSRCHSLGSQAEVCVENINSAYNRNVLYLAKDISKFTMIFRLCLMRGIYC